MTHAPITKAIPPTIQTQKGVLDVETNTEVCHEHFVIDLLLAAVRGAVFVVATIIAYAMFLPAILYALLVALVGAVKQWSKQNFRIRPVAVSPHRTRIASN